MLKEQCENLIEIEIKGLYPQWQPSGKAVALFRSVLLSFDFDIAKRAVNNCYIQFSGREPKLDRILKLCKRYQADLAPAGIRLGEPVKAYALRKLESRDRRNFYQAHGPLAHFDERLDEAHQMKEEHERIYGGQWEVEIPTS